MFSRYLRVLRSEARSHRGVLRWEGRCRSCRTPLFYDEHVWPSSPHPAPLIFMTGIYVMCRRALDTLYSVLDAEATRKKPCKDY